MKLSTYKANREIFLSRYEDNKFEGNIIEHLLQGIYNKRLFFKILTVDTHCQLHCIVSSIDRYKRYKNWNGVSGSRLWLTNKKFSRYDKYPDLYYKDLLKIKL